MSRILVIDDEENIVFYVQQALSSVGHQVLAAKTADEAIGLAARQPVDLAVLDLRMPGKSGFELYAELARDKAIPVLFITAFASDQTLGVKHDVAALDAAFSKGTAAILYKPFTIQALLQKVTALLAAAGAA